MHLSLISCALPEKGARGPFSEQPAESRDGTHRSDGDGAEPHRHARFEVRQLCAEARRMLREARRRRPQTYFCWHMPYIVGKFSMGAIRFVWDRTKSETNARKHGVAFSEAETAFLNDEALVTPDPDHSEDEDLYTNHAGFVTRIVPNPTRARGTGRRPTLVRGARAGPPLGRVQCILTSPETTPIAAAITVPSTALPSPAGPRRS